MQSSVVTSSSPTRSTDVQRAEGRRLAASGRERRGRPEQLRRDRQPEHRHLQQVGHAAVRAETTNTLFTGFGGGCEDNDDGDAHGRYDRLADRWVISQFSVTTTPYLQCVAVSKTGDPTGAYCRYAFQYNDFPGLPEARGLAGRLLRHLQPLRLQLHRARGLRVRPGEDAQRPGADQHCYILDAQYGGMLPSDLDGSDGAAARRAELRAQLRHRTTLDLWKFQVNWSGPGDRRADRARPRCRLLPSRPPAATAARASRSRRGGGTRRASPG